MLRMLGGHVERKAEQEIGDVLDVKLSGRLSRKFTGRLYFEDKMDCDIYLRLSFQVFLWICSRS